MVGEDSIMKNFINCTARLIKMIKSRRMQLERHVARIDEERNHYSVLMKKSEGKRQYETWKKMRGQY